MLVDLLRKNNNKKIQMLIMMAPVYGTNSVLTRKALQLSKNKTPVVQKITRTIKEQLVIITIVLSKKDNRIRNKTRKNK